MAKYKVMLAKFPGQWVEHPASAGWMTELALKIERQHPEIEMLPWRKTDTPIPMVRNQAVRVALANGVDYLLMLDNDMEPDPKGEGGKLLYPGARPFWDVAWEHMMAHRDEPCAIAAPYCGPSPWNNIFVFLWRNHNNHPESFSLAQFSREEAARRGGVEEVAALPTGLILYDVRVFRTMVNPHFYYEYTDEWQTEKASTEDVTQTRDMSLAWYMSAGQRGGKVYCAWDSWAIHIKPERVGRPQMHTPETVGQNLKAALARGPAAERVHVIGSGDPIRWRKGNGEVAALRAPGA